MRLRDKRRRSTFGHPESDCIPNHATPLFRAGEVLVCWGGTLPVLLLILYNRGFKNIWQRDTSGPFIQSLRLGMKRK